MKRVVCTHVGDTPAESVALVEVDPPAVGAAEVLVRVLARPINPADELLLTGRHVFQPTYPAPVGIEGVGVVVEAGPAATVGVGTRVALPYGGTWAEFVSLPADVVVPVADEIPLEQAAMLCVNPMTAAGLLEGLASGDWIALNAAHSAIGRMIIELAVRRGLNVIAAVRRPEAAAALLRMGARAVLPDDDALPTAVRAVAGLTGVRRGLDAVAGEGTGRLYRCVGDGGDLIVYGLLSDDRAILPAAEIVFRDVTVRGYSRLRGYAALTPARRSAIGAEVVAAMVKGELLSPVEARYPLEAVADALRHHGRPGRQGKILLVSQG